MQQPRATLCLPKIALVMVTALTPSLTVAGQVTQEWATALADTGRSDSGELVKTDAAGNTIVAGSSLMTAEDWDIVVAKLDPAGVPIWSLHITGGGTGSLVPFSLEVGPSGDIVIVGQHSVAFDDVRIVTVALDPGGSEKWRAIYHTVGAQDSAAGVILTRDGGVILAGTTTRPSDNSPQAVTAFVLAYDSAGAVRWRNMMANGRAQVGIGGLGWDPDTGAVYVTGTISGRNNKGPTLYRYDVDGRLDWMKTFMIREDASVMFNRVAVDPDGHVLLAGGYHITNCCDNIQIMKVDSSTGRIIWSTVYGTADGNPLFEYYASDMAIDSGGNILVAGRVSPAQGGSGSALLLKYAPGGSLTWAVADTRFYRSADRFAIDPAGAAYLTGVQQSFDGQFHRNVWLTTRYGDAGEIDWSIEYDGNPSGPLNGGAGSLTLDGGDVVVTGSVNGDLHTVRYDQF